LRAIGLAACLAAPILGAAADPAAPVQDWTQAIESVVVTAPPAGPALWHIVRGSSEVWILPTVSPMPEDLTWNSDNVARLLKGANALLLPPSASVGVFEGTWFLLTGMSTIEQPDGVTLEATLPDPLKGRFVAARRRFGRDADRYEELLGGVAALRLEGDYWSFAHLTPNGPQKAVERLARHEGVRVRVVADYPAMDVIHAIPKMTADAHRACIGFALDDIDTAGAHAAAAAGAWATGDLTGMKAHYFEIRLDDCWQQNAAYAVLRERAIADETGAILAALKSPGRTVVVMPMGLFLRKGAVLDRLEAAGVTVNGPGG